MPLQVALQLMSQSRNVNGRPLFAEGSSWRMKLSTKGRYAMVALCDLATQPEETLLSLGEISRRQDISLPYLEQLFVKLRRAGLVDSVRGPGGGYRLANPPVKSGWPTSWGRWTKP